MAHHRIRRQRWHVRAPCSEAAFAWRHELRSRLESDLLAALAQAFDGLGLGDHVLRIPRLSIELAAPDVSGVARALAPAIASALGPAVMAAARASGHATGTVGEPVGTDWRASLHHYLRLGRLPWELVAHNRAEVRTALQHQAGQLATAAPPLPIPDALDLSLRHAWSRRLLELLAPATWHALVSRLRAASGRRWPDRRDRVRAPGPSPAPADAPEDLVDVLLPGVALAPEAADDLRLEVAAWVLALAERPSGHAAAGVPAIAALLRRVPDQVLSVVKGRPGCSTGESVREPLPVREPAAGAQPSPPRDLDADFDLAVADSGLVLLHPFLTALFTRLGLATGFPPGIAADALPKAAALLHWLVAGTDDVLEFDCGVAKVLLGLAPDDPLPVIPGGLTEAERSEADALLTAVLQHWHVLRSTSVPGLRATFLARGGLLRRDDQGCHLRVQPASFDMLLDHVPWGYGVVRLPWMAAPLWTEWRTP